MTKCWCCSSADHDHTTCPLFGKADEFLAHVLQPTQSEPLGSSLAPTLLEDLYGQDAEPLLQDALDNPDLTPEQQEMALKVLSGETKLTNANNEERSVIDEIALQMASSKPKAQEPPATIPRPGYVRTQTEMEDFGDTVGGALQPAGEPYASVNRASEPPDEPTS